MYAMGFQGHIMHGGDVFWALTNLVDRPRLFVELNSLGFQIQKAEMLIARNKAK